MRMRWVGTCVVDHVGAGDIPKVHTPLERRGIGNWPLACLVIAIGGGRGTDARVSGALLHGRHCCAVFWRSGWRWRFGVLSVLAP